MSNFKENIEIGLGCLSMPLMLLGFIIFVAILPLCFIIGLSEIIIYIALGLILRLWGIDIFNSEISNPACIVGLILLVITVVVIFIAYPDLFFNLLLLGEDYFPRLKP